jgi:hypothetical protein
MARICFLTYNVLIGEWRVAMETKMCVRCRDPKSLSEFGKRPGNRDGHKGQCYSCCNEVERVRIAKRKAEKALWHRRAQGIPDHNDSIPRRRCHRCKENRLWNEYPEVTRKNQGIDFMCNECRGKADESRRRKASARLNKKRLSAKYRAKMKADAQSWRAYLKSTGRIWYGTIREDAKQWREHGKKETQAQA